MKRLVESAVGINLIWSKEQPVANYHKVDVDLKKQREEVLEVVFCSRMVNGEALSNSDGKIRAVDFKVCLLPPSPKSQGRFIPSSLQ